MSELFVVLPCEITTNKNEVKNNQTFEGKYNVAAKVCTPFYTWGRGCV